MPKKDKKRKHKNYKQKNKHFMCDIFFWKLELHETLKTGSVLTAL